MDTQANPPIQPPKKNRKWLWLILFSILGCLCLVVAVIGIAILNNPLYLNLFKTGEPRTDIDAGAYEGTVYTAPDGLFTCNFKSIMTPGLNPILQAYIDEKQGNGVVYARDDFGQQFGVEYLKVAMFTDKGIANALSRPETQAGALQAILEEGLLPSRGEKAEILDMEFVEPDLLFAAIKAPGGSHLTITEGDSEPRPADSVEDYYIFTRGEWLYFVYHLQTPLFDDQIPASRVDEFYRGCQFKQ